MTAYTRNTSMELVHEMCLTFDLLDSRGRDIGYCYTVFRRVFEPAPKCAATFSKVPPGVHYSLHGGKTLDGERTGQNANVTYHASLEAAITAGDKLAANVKASAQRYNRAKSRDLV